MNGAMRSLLSAAVLFRRLPRVWTNTRRRAGSASKEELLGCLPARARVDRRKARHGTAVEEHGQYMLKLYVNGTMKFAGPFLDDAGGAVVFEAENENEAKSRGG